MNLVMTYFSNDYFFVWKHLNTIEILFYIVQIPDYWQQYLNSMVNYWSQH